MASYLLFVWLHQRCKRPLLTKSFENSKIALVYGPAGTGKTTLVNYISRIFDDYNKLYLANTNPAVDNLKRRVVTKNGFFSTIERYNMSFQRTHIGKRYNLIFIDECSTVSNSDLMKILDYDNYDLLVLVGDVYQIESIRFGNWFSVVSSYVPKKAVHELTEVHRTNERRLLELWKNVRSNEPGLLEYLVKGRYSHDLDNTIFENSSKDQIILCLNYNGIYGINSINHILQGNNHGYGVSWGLNTYKIGDPVLFNESYRFHPLIYNNMKGIIRGIQADQEKITFDIEINKVITDLDEITYDFKVIKRDNNSSVIRFIVNKYKNSDDDTDSADTVVPFNVAYAVSIHKSQGLEYDSVKIVISDEVSDLITHNIFYTAITRTKKDLMIYWSKGSSEKILNSFEHRDINKDVQLLNSICKLHGKAVKTK